jgi:hypothetical protein
MTGPRRGRGRVRAIYEGEPDRGQMLREVETPFAWLSHRTVRPLCYVCFLSLTDDRNRAVLGQLLDEVHVQQDALWPDPLEED